MDARGIVEDVDDITVENILIQLLFIGTDCLKLIPRSTGSFFRHRFDELFADTVQDGGGGDGFMQSGVFMES